MTTWAHPVNNADKELMRRFWAYYRQSLRRAVEDRNVANRIMGIPPERWVKYKEPNDNMLTMP